MADRYDKQGGVQVPLATGGISAGGSIVSVADPTIEDLLSKFKTVLNNKLSDAWSKCAGQLSSAAVVGTYPYQPMPMLARLTWAWPALFMWRETETYGGHSQVYRQAKSRGHLMYILPPLPYAHAVQLEPIRVAARVCLDMYIYERGDPEVSSGANPMSANTLKSFSFVSGEYTYLEGPELNLAHPALDMTFDLEERQSHVTDNYSALTRIDTTIDIATDGVGSAVTTLVTMYSTVGT